MVNIPPKLADIIRDLASSLALGQEGWLVGGTVRDRLLGRETGDIDLVVSGSPGDFAASAATLLGGVAFVMDAEREVFRVVIKEGEHSPRPALPRRWGGTKVEHMQLDVSPLKGSIKEDLAARDFTINAMAIGLHPHPPTPSPMPPPGPLGHPPPQVGRGKGRLLMGRGGEASKGGKAFALSPKGTHAGIINLPSPPAGEGPGVGAIIDPFGGRADLQGKLIRALGREALADDPLRMLRAFRLAGSLGFGIEPTTLAWIKGLAALVSSASGERVRDEIYLILEEPDASGTFADMALAGLLKEVLPETAAMEGLPQGEAHRHDLLTHSLKSMEYAELVMDYLDRYFGAREREVREYLDITVDGGLTNRGLVKLAALLHDVGKPRTMVRDKGRTRFTGHDEEGAAINAGIAVRLKFSARASTELVKVTSGHMRPLHMSYGVPTRHAVYRYVRDMGEYLPASLIVALADAMATRDDPDVFPTDVEGLAMELAEYYYGEYSEARSKPLIKGQDLIDVFGLKPGPVFKVILGDVEERRATGLLKSRDEALRHVMLNLFLSCPGDSGPGGSSRSTRVPGLPHRSGRGRSSR